MRVLAVDFTSPTFTTQAKGAAVAQSVAVVAGAPVHTGSSNPPVLSAAAHVPDGLDETAFSAQVAGTDSARPVPLWLRKTRAVELAEWKR